MELIRPSVDPIDDPATERGDGTRAEETRAEEAARRRAAPPVRTFLPGSFDPARHYYPTVLSAQLHPTVERFLALEDQQVIERYCRLHPRVDREVLSAVLGYRPVFLRWAGCDLFHAIGEDARRVMVIVETNSSPSGQKSMPLPVLGAPSPEMLEGGYRRLVESTILSAIPRDGGVLAVLFDKNEMEASGYAASLASATGETVYLVPFEDGETDPPARFVGGALEVLTPDRGWQRARAALRYVTQRPWNRIPPLSSTTLLNPVIACIAGGRNKAMAALAYERLNEELRGSGLRVNTPETMVNVRKEELAEAVEYFGGSAVVKVPYGNAGQGVFTVISERELQELLATDFPYERFLVQSLVGDARWLHRPNGRTLFHVGSAPSRTQPMFAIDVRMMVIDTPRGLRPVALYGRRAHKPLPPSLPIEAESWEFLGTNLSVKKDDGGWATETDRLLPCDTRTFDTIGIGLDELIDAYVQTTLSVVAIDKIARSLVSSAGTLRYERLAAVIEDAVLLEEIRTGDDRAGNYSPSGAEQRMPRRDPTR